MKKETARKAAKWWADFLRNGARLDNGDKSETGAMTMMLGAVLQSSAKNPEEKIMDFENELTKTIEEQKPYSLYCDYGPDYYLANAAEKSGLDVNMASFPWKTGMWFDGDKITVSEGYGAQRRELE